MADGAGDMCLEGTATTFLTAFSDERHGGVAALELAAIMTAGQSGITQSGAGSTGRGDRIRLIAGFVVTFWCLTICEN